MEARAGRVIRLAIVGAGNVATHLAAAFHGAPEVDLACVLSRSQASAERLRAQLDPRVVAGSDYSLLRELKPDVVLISVADQGLGQVAEAIGWLDYAPLVVHTSGTLPKEILDCVSSRTGIIYPLQTFSLGTPVGVSSVPFFNEAARAEDLALIDELTSRISRSIHHADAEHRRVLHIAGVFSCNFPNILLECTAEILGRAGYSLDVVEPLVQATVDKAFAIGPHAAQTGPARRGDLKVIDKQRSALEGNLRAIYDLLTEQILNSHKQA